MECNGTPLWLWSIAPQENKPTLPSTRWTLSLVAGAGIGDGNDLNVAVATLAALNDNTGSIVISNTGDLTIGDVEGLPGVINEAAGGNIDISTIGSMTINEEVSTNGSGTILFDVGNGYVGSNSTLAATVNGATVTVNAGNGNDVLLIDFGGGAIFPNGLTFDGNTGSADELQVSDVGDGTGRTYTIDNTQVRGYPKRNRLFLCDLLFRLGIFELWLSVFGTRFQTTNHALDSTNANPVLA